jgi:hypothetical protein
VVIIVLLYLYSTIHRNLEYHESFIPLNNLTSKFYNTMTLVAPKIRSYLIEFSKYRMVRPSLTLTNMCGLKRK